jgi:hypothetical protein
MRWRELLRKVTDLAGLAAAATRRDHVHSGVFPLGSVT